jgi:hypothetical protein
VGAAIAAGSQGENGKSADLVDKAIKSNRAINVSEVLDSIIK